MKSRPTFCSLALMCSLMLVSLGAASRCMAQQPAATAAAASDDDSPGYYYAIVIGIDEYNGKPGGLPKLQTAVADAKAIAAVLQDKYDFDVKLLLDGDATNMNIKKILRDYRGKVGPSDSLLIYYAGHGNQDGPDNRAFWLPADSETDEPGEPASIMSDDISLDLKLMRARHVLVISDSCYSGSMGQNGKKTVLYSNTPDYLRTMMSHPSLNIMSSGGKAPVADGGMEGHSPFAYALLKELQERDEPAFSASSIFDYVEQLVEDQTQHNQQPYLFQVVDIQRDVNAGDFVFVKKGVDLSKLAAPPPPTAPPPAPSPAPSAPKSPANLMPVDAADYNIGAAYLAGNKFTDALPYLSKACTAGNWKACSAMGNMYEEGEGVKQDYFAAFALYKTACDGGHMLSCSDEGFLYDKGYGTQKDVAQATKLYDKSCTGGSALGCHNLGVAYKMGNGVAPNSVTAVSLFQKSCNGGYTDGCVALGEMYRDGIGVPADTAMAFNLFKKGCDGQDPKGCNDEAILYEHGQGVAADLQKAFDLYTTACKAGDQNACVNTGRFYRDGKVVAKDAQQGIQLFKTACSLQAADGCVDAGLMEVTGQGVAVNLQDSFNLFKAGCALNNAKACYDEGVSYEKGNGVAQSIPNALALYKTACDAKDQQACTSLKNLQK